MTQGSRVYAVRVNDDAEDRLIKDFRRSLRRAAVSRRTKPLVLALMSVVLGNLLAYGAQHHDWHVIIEAGLIALLVLAYLLLTFWD